MIPYPKEKAASEILGAILLVAMLMTGLAIISVLLLSVPPPSSSMKAITGVKCSWCPDIIPPQYDILIDHEGGENLNTNGLIFTLFFDDGTSLVVDPTQISIFGDAGIFDPPQTCDGRVGVPWPGVTGQLSTGQSLKHSFRSVNNPIGVLIQEPSGIGLSTVSRVKINYIHNISNTSTETGSYGLVHVDHVLFDLVPSIGPISPWTPDGCDVEFLYLNTGTDPHPFPFGSTQQSMWNYIEKVGPLTQYDEPVDFKLDSFPPGSGTAVKIKHLKGKIIYNLGSASTNQVTCLEYEKSSY